MTLDHNDTEFQGYDFTIVSADQELSPELVSDVARVRSSGVDAGVKEAESPVHDTKFLEVSDTEYGDHYEVTGIVDKFNGSALEEICQEGALVTVLSDDCDMVDGDWEVLEATVSDESIMDGNNDPRYLFSLILQE